MAGRTEIRHYFGGVQKRLYNSAQRRLAENLPSIMSALRDYVEDEQRKGKFGSMTGNWINSFGVAAYRDGHCFAVCNMNGEVDGPIRTTLIDYDIFPKGERRYDNSVQQEDFEVVDGTAEQVFYDEEVLAWLSRTWSRSKGFSFRIISVTEYHKKEARIALLRLSDEIESKGGTIWNFHL